MGHSRLTEDPPWADTLTRREAEVLRATAQGLSIDKTAKELRCGREAIRTHLQSLYRKLGVHERHALVAEAWRTGFAR